MFKICFCFNLGGELGSGAFGVVYVAQAVGMADFLTRRSALKDTKPQRRFSLARPKKRSPVLSINDCDVVKTAVKTLKGNQNTDITIFIFFVLERAQSVPFLQFYWLQQWAEFSDVLTAVQK